MGAIFRILLSGLIFITLSYFGPKKLFKFLRKESLLKVHEGLPSLEKLTLNLTRKGPDSI
jgi:hypothetical protein